MVSTGVAHFGSNPAGDFFADLSTNASSNNADRVRMNTILKSAKRKANETLSAEFGNATDNRIACMRQRLNSTTTTTSKNTNGHADSKSVSKLAADRVLVKTQITRRAGRKAVIDPVKLTDVEKNDNDTTLDTTTFTGMGLSRSSLKAVSQLGFATPTPVQAATIPAIFTGRDVCVCAATGTGKTAAYLLPILERILNKKEEESSDVSEENATRVLILVPTRELAVQVYTVAEKLAAFSKNGITMALASGGLDIRQQALQLRNRPTIVIATPGRLLDHAHASAELAKRNNVDSSSSKTFNGFSLNNVEVLVLDEADRMLDESFDEQIREIISLLPSSASRQTMLFSATLSDEVVKLADSLLHRRPQRITCNDESILSAPNLTQEYVRVRREDMRQALLEALVVRYFSTQTLIFVRTKIEAHRIRIILGLFNVRASELHSNLSQAQRLETLYRFGAERNIDVLVATDIAARGIDIPLVHTVINYRMPSTIKAYVHRVGRTARAGNVGRSVSLVGEDERKVLRQIIQMSREPLTSRSIPPDVGVQFKSKILSFDSAVEEILQAEKEPSLPASTPPPKKKPTEDEQNSDDDNVSSRKQPANSSNLPPKIRNKTIKKIGRRAKRRAEGLEMKAANNTKKQHSKPMKRNSANLPPQQHQKTSGRKRVKKAVRTAFSVDLSRERIKD